MRRVVDVGDRVSFRYHMSWENTLVFEGQVENTESAPMYIVGVIPKGWENAKVRHYMVKAEDIVSVNGEDV